MSKESIIEFSLLPTNTSLVGKNAKAEIGKISCAQTNKGREMTNEGKTTIYPSGQLSECNHRGLFLLSRGIIRNETINKVVNLDNISRKIMSPAKGSYRSNSDLEVVNE